MVRLETFFQICWLSPFDWHFFTASFTDCFLHITGLSFIVRLKIKNAVPWCVALEAEPFFLSIDIILAIS